MRPLGHGSVGALVAEPRIVGGRSRWSWVWFRGPRRQPAAEWWLDRSRLRSGEQKKAAENQARRQSSYRDNAPSDFSHPRPMPPRLYLPTPNIQSRFNRLFPRKASNRLLLSSSPFLLRTPFSSSQPLLSSTRPEKATLIGPPIAMVCLFPPLSPIASSEAPMIPMSQPVFLSSSGPRPADPRAALGPQPPPGPHRRRAPCSDALQSLPPRRRRLGFVSVDQA